MRKQSDPSVAEALRSWRALNRVLMELDEPAVERALRIERSNKRRPNIVKRLHQRLGRLRAKRERDELRRAP